jgi:putative CocE/NonD family hydrolase
MRRLGLIILSLLLAAPASGQPALELVPMRDGTELATDVWLPDELAVPMPVLLRRTPYGRAFDAATARLIVALGYALVSQDVRGRGDSDGAFSPFRDDAQDGFDTIAWIADRHIRPR